MGWHLLTEPVGPLGAAAGAAPPAAACAAFIMSSGVMLPSAAAFGTRRARLVLQPAPMLLKRSDMCGLYA